MSKKRVSGAWVDDTPHIYNTSTDTFSTLPHEVIGDGTAISSYTIKGNMVQSGTPTPSNPIYPQEVGDLVTTGEHAGEYEIPILSNGNTYPVYLSEPIRKINTYADSLASSGTVTRAIKQVAFTGQEEWEHYGSSVFWTKVENNGVLVNGNGLSNSYIYNPTTSNVPTTIENGECGLTSSNGRVYIKNTNYANATAFKQYLANQYVAGTPVTVWYVLATATTETFTAPTLPTSGSPQTFDVDTTLKPSEVSLTYHGWHEHSDTKYTSG